MGYLETFLTAERGDTWAVLAKTTDISEDKVEHNLQQCTALRRQNTSLPIFRLPTELLLEIFLLFAEHTLSYDRKRSPAILSFVCYHWRQILLNCGSFWGHIITLDSSPRWIEEMLSRSREANIHLRASFRFGPSFPLLFKDLGRLQSFKMTSIDPAERRYEVWLRQPAPSLERLNISLNSFSVPLHGQSILTIPGSLFAGHAPSLRHISLRNCIFRFPDVSILQNLASLSVQGYKQDSSPTAAEWLEALGHMPSLQDLRLLEGSLSSVGVDEDLPYVFLPRLKRLYISHQPHVFSRILDHLTLPSMCSLLLSTADEGTQKDMAFTNAIGNLKKSLRSFTRGWPSSNNRINGTIRWMFSSFRCIHVTVEFSSLPTNTSDDTVFVDQCDAFDICPLSLCLEIYDIDRDLFEPFLENFTRLLRECGLRDMIQMMIVQYYRFPVEIGPQFIEPILRATPLASIIKVREPEAIEVFLKSLSGNLNQDNGLASLNHLILDAENIEDSELTTKNTSLLLEHLKQRQCLGRGLNQLTLHCGDGEKIKRVINNETTLCINVECQWNSAVPDE